MIVFDTSAAIRLFERRQADVVDVVRRYRSFVISAVTLGEFERGIAAAVDDSVRAARRAALERCIEVADVIDVNRRLSAAWGALAATTTRKLSHNDLWILATAELSGLPLCSSDDRLTEAAIHHHITVERVAA